MNRRQVFLSHKQYHDFLESLAGEEAHWQTHSMMADSPSRKPLSRLPMCAARACTT
ncbi:hypothetical protein [Pseudomonas protegens]|uniref:hypothetical protein n=1 Tax=Pseudomonas protegens TaxID=380021 RepID=UPI001CDACBFA|nr:hypothetical protein [Pseudomonas protegens]